MSRLRRAARHLHRIVPQLVCCAALMGLPLVASAQPRVDWTLRPSPGPIARIEDAMVYDSVSGKAVMFGGYDLNFQRMNDIWEYDPALESWTNSTLPAGSTMPQRRSGHAMAYDPVHRTVLVFGGLNDSHNYLGDTWEWNSVTKTWNQWAVGGPAGRQGARMVYDTVNNRILLFGGVDLNTFYQDTWAWNTTTHSWTNLNPAAKPVGRTFHGMVFNTATSRAIVFGGIGYPCGTSGGCSVADFNDLWEYNSGSNTWVQISTSGAVPAGRGWMGMAYDSAANRIVMYGGFQNTAPQFSWGDTWTFSGNTWTQIYPHPNSPPLVRDSHAMVYDQAHNKMVMFGGYLADVWEFAGSVWTHAGTTHWPPAQTRHSLVYDSDRDVTWMYGAGAAEVWEYSLAAGTWLSLNGGGPTGRLGAAAAYEQPQGRIILFGGQSKNSETLGAVQGDTWAWNTQARTWSNVTPGTSPPARLDHALAHSAAANHIVMFGGRNASGTALGDTWVWNGTTWTSVPAGGPAARFGHAMAYDAVRGVVVLFGGDNGSQRFNDVWEWNGSSWSNRTPGSGSPSARTFAALSRYDSTSAGVVMFGGTTGVSLLGDAWLWNGTAWSQATASSPAPTTRQGAKAVYDTAARRVLVFGGTDVGGVNGDIWLATVSPAVSYPYPVQVTPSQSQGSSATFTAVYRGTGSSALSQAWFLINSTLSYPGGVLVYHARGTNQLLLRNDNDTAWIAGTIGSGVLANSQVTIDLATASVSPSGTDLTLTLPMVFKPAFNGPRNIYMFTNDASGSAAPDGWRLKGTFFVNAGSTIPSAVSVTPASGSGTAQRFDVVYRDFNGVTDLQQTYFLVNANVSGASAAHLYYVPAANRLYLRDDADSTWGAGAVPGAAGVLSNSQVSIDMAAVTIGKTATDLTLSVPLTFAPSFAGAKNLYGFAVDFSNQTSGVSYQPLGTYTVLGAAPPPPPPTRRTRSDFDGDGKTDVGVFRPSNGMWYLIRSATGGYSAAWGGGGDIPVPADYDGDRKTDLAVFRPSDGTWYVALSASGATSTVTWGGGGDVPVPFDYDGDGKADIAVFRPSSGVWYIIQSATGTAFSVTWGGGTDIPAVGDYDGDGKADVAIFRPSTGAWHVIRSATSTAWSVTWGGGGDVPVVGDYDGDGKTDVAIFRPSTGAWHVIRSATSTAWSVTWGGGGDIPVVGDYDGDGKADVAVFRPSSGAWYIIQSLTGTAAGVTWGGGGDIPLPSKP